MSLIFIDIYWFHWFVLRSCYKLIRFENCTLTKKAANLDFFFHTGYKLICLWNGDAVRFLYRNILMKTKSMIYWVSANWCPSNLIDLLFYLISLVCSSQKFQNFKVRQIIIYWASTSQLIPYIYNKFCSPLQKLSYFNSILWLF